MINIYNFQFKKKDAGEWQMEKDYQGVDVLFFAEEKLLKQMDEEVFIQARNVAQLPGLAGPVNIMPDAHSGYGAPIGTVFAMDKDEGFVSPGAVGYDINCGMRLILTNLFVDEVKDKLNYLVNHLFEAVPPGLGRRGFLTISRQELKSLVEEGVGRLVKKGIGWPQDQEKIEENGMIAGASLSAVSPQAIERGISQLATLGSGNHYLEIQKVEKIFDSLIAEQLGIKSVNQIVVMVHCGSRGFGHQICSNYLRMFEKKLDQFKIKMADRQLVCAPIDSPAGRQYLAAMASAANFAFVNRQAITYQIRKTFEKVFNKKAEDLGMSLVYDLAHNIAKFEGNFLIHRKGATRSFPETPVILGGSMETGSYLLVGTEEALTKSYGSTAHGSGRTMSRTKAKKLIKGEKLWREMKDKGIYVKSASFAGLAEEAGLAYKNIAEVVNSIELAGLSKSVAYLKPIGNIKG